MKTITKVLLALPLLAAAGAGGYFAARAFVEPDPTPALVAEAATPTAGHELFASRREPVPANPQPAELQQAPVETESRWARLNREAIDLLDEGRFEEAIDRFELCRRGMPGQPVFDRNLAEALVRLALRDHDERHPCEHCLATLERAIELSPKREDLALLHERWAAEAAAESGFWRESSLHFDLAYDGGRDELLWGSHRILDELESVYGDLGLLFGRYPVEEGAPRISVVLYRREGFDSVTKLGDWAGGAFDGTVRIPVEDFEQEEASMQRVLRHELVHAFVRAVGGGGVPGWLNEGLAQWLELERAQGLEAARRQQQGRAWFPLERLQGSLASWDDQQEILLAYGQSLLLCDHVAHEYGERVLFQMVEGCADGVDPAKTFEELTNVPLALALEDLAQGR